MKILLRSYDSQFYVWKTAKYRDGHFYVYEEQIEMSNIVSVINDNRKGYVRCSMCRKTFKRNDPKFDIHRKNATGPVVCYDCPHMFADRQYVKGRTERALGHVL